MNREGAVFETQPGDGKTLKTKTSILSLLVACLIHIVEVEMKPDRYS